MSLGERMKGYEKKYQQTLNPQLYTIIRLDGKAFHTYTKWLTRPFDLPFIEAMNETALYLAQHISGCQIGYVQSDEITLTLARPCQSKGEWYFNGNIQKIVSITASMAGAVFNRVRERQGYVSSSLAHFDCRVFQVPSLEEVINNLVWRQEDCLRNSLLMVVQGLVPHEKLQGKKREEQLRLCQENDDPWEAYDESLQRGRFLHRSSSTERRTYIRHGEECEAEVERMVWTINAAPHFRLDRHSLLQHLSERDV